MLPDTAKLDYEVLVKVVQSGHSRVPVYKEVDVPDLLNAGKTRRIKKILGILLVKNCVLLDPEGAWDLRFEGPGARLVADSPSPPPPPPRQTRRPSCRSRSTRTSRPSPRTSRS